MPDRNRGRFEKKIRQVHWTFASFGATGFAAGTVASNMLAAQHLPETLLRIRGEVMCHLDGAIAPNVALSLGMGLIQVPEGTGSTVLWSPLTDGDAPWIWWDVFALGYSEPVVDVIAVQTAMAARRIIDSKAMRKFRNTELQFVAENITTQTAGSVDILGAFRVLAGS